ncbi:unnamed protein product, partial [Ascophyllum nodosum]
SEEPSSFRLPLTALCDRLLLFVYFQVTLTDSCFVLPHALYLAAHLSYRLRPVEDQLYYLSHDLCVRAKRIKEYNFDCQLKIGNLMASLRSYMEPSRAQGGVKSRRPSPAWKPSAIWGGCARSTPRCFAVAASRVLLVGMRIGFG